MTPQTASLLIRQHMALVEEGIGPVRPDPDDEDTLAEAATLAVAADMFDHHELWDCRLVSDDEHFTTHPDCDRHR